MEARTPIAEPPSLDPPGSVPPAPDPPSPALPSILGCVAEFTLRVRGHTVVIRRTRGISRLHCVECTPHRRVVEMNIGTFVRVRVRSGTQMDNEQLNTRIQGRFGVVGPAHGLGRVKESAGSVVERRGCERSYKESKCRPLSISARPRPDGFAFLRCIAITTASLSPRKEVSEPGDACMCGLQGSTRPRAECTPGSYALLVRARARWANGQLIRSRGTREAFEAHSRATGVVSPPAARCAG